MIRDSILSTNVFRPMTRNLLLLFTVALAACGKAPTVSVFTAAPVTIAKGSSSTLVFAAEDAEQLTLEPGGGNVTGKTQLVVSPTETTTYILKASNDSGETTQSLTVTVGPTPAAGFKLTAAGPFTAGTPANVTVTAVDPSGATVPAYTGTVHLVSNDGAAELPADFTFSAADKGVKTVPVTFRTSGPRLLVASGTVGGGMKGTFSTTSEPFTVKAGAAHTMRLSDLPAESESGTEVSFQVSFVDAFGNAAREYTTVLSVQSSDETAPAVPAVNLVEANQGQATVRLTFFKAGVQSVTVQDTQKASVKASAEFRVRPGTAVAYAFSPLPATARAGEPVALTLTALDARGNRAHAYSGTARITSADTALQPTADAVFSQGVAHVSVAFRTPGNQTVTATEVGGALTKTSNAVKVTSAEAMRIVLSGTGPATATAGGSATFTATVQDTFGNTVTDYQGTVGFSSTDPRVVLPSAYTFTEQDMGTRGFSATFKTAGTQTLTVADTARAGVTASAPFMVKAGPAHAMRLSNLPAESESDTEVSFQVSFVDAFGNAAQEYTTVLSVQHSDETAPVVPAVTLVEANQGLATVRLTLFKAGVQTITVQDTQKASVNASAELRVRPGTAVAYTLSPLPATARAGEPVALTLTALDARGNRAQAYSGTARISSADMAMQPTADAVFSQGVAHVSVAFRTPGNQTVTATEVGGTLTKTSNAVKVTSAEAARIVLSETGPATAGESATFTATVQDTFGNTVTDYQGTVRFSSTDSRVVLPSAYTFTEQDMGTRGFSATFKTAGAQTLTVADTARARVTTSESFTVKAGPAHAMRLSDLPAEVESGAEVSFQVSFVDAFGNAAREHTTVLSVQHSDETAPVVPAVNLVEANQGLAIVRLTFFKAGAQSVTVQDTQKDSVTATAELRVRPGTAMEYALSPLPATARAGESLALTLTALDARGNRAQAYSGTARITSADMAMQLPANAVFSQGVAHVSVAFRTPGNQTVTATEVGGTLTKTSNTVKVTSAEATRIVLSGAGPATAGGSATFTATVQDTFGNTVTDYQGTVSFSSTDPSVVLPSAYTFTEQDMGTRGFSATFKTAGTQTLTVADTVRARVTASAPFMVKAGPAHAMRLSNLPAESESGAEVSFQVSFVDAFGNAAREHTTVLSVQHSDETAPAVPAVNLVEADQGLAIVRLTFFKAGVQTITVQDTQKASVTATAELRVRPGTAVEYALSPLPDAARVGEPLALTLTALDARGNRAQAYSGTARISTTDTAMKPLANVVFSQGVAHVSVAFRTPGNQTVTATEVGGTLTKTSNTVKVTSAEATRIVLSGAGPATAGGSATFTATVQDAFGHTVTDYQGTVSFSSTDPSVVLPAAYTFTEQDMGTRGFSATFKTAGMQTLTLADTVRAGVTGSVGFNVSAAAASGCAISDVPSTTTAGTQFPVRVTVRDEFSNTAIGYGGTVTLTSTDAHASASLPEATAFVPAADQGSRVFGAKLVSANTQTITAADATGAWSCMATVRITPATPRIQVALPTDANAGYPVTALVSVKDVYGNAISQTGSLSFTSTDAAATLPATVALDENGSATVSATFKTLGAQQLKAALATDASVSGTGTISVHGLVYTDPQPGVGKVRLVVNQAASSASVVQLDLVSNTTLTATGSATIPARGGAYSAGMNLPLNTSRVMADTTLLVEGNTLNLGAAPKAVAAALPTSGPTAGVLYTGVSQKIDGAGKATGDVGVLPGRVYYSVRLKLPASATVGAVFDGVSLDQRFRAAVRGRGGDEVLSSADFAIGKLEVR